MMFVSLIICTYNRPDSLRRLLFSVSMQTRRYDELIIVDSSEDESNLLRFDITSSFNKVKYYHVDVTNKGLTKQRNFGLNQLSENCTHVTFLDDDLLLDEDFNKMIVSSFLDHPEAIGISGLDMVENRYFQKNPFDTYSSNIYFEFRDWIIKEPFRYRLRKILGLMSKLDPEKIPLFGHGRNGYPPDSGIHYVDHIMGGIATYKKEVFNHISFSEKFKGYGLYEDYDFSVRASNFGKLYVNTSAKVWHYHDAGGRPNMYRYGRMVVRNGWYVWRVKYPNPGINNILKWHAITLLLAFLRLCNAFSVKKQKGALGDFLGRIVGWFSLFIVSPSKRL